MTMSSPFAGVRHDPSRATLRGPDGRAIRVLVVDDEQTLSELVGLALRYEGWEVRTAADGRLRSPPPATSGPDLVVLDVMLPDIDGLEVLRRMRADIDRMPVLFLTARDDVRTGSPGSRPAATTTSPSRSPSRSWCCGCGPCCAGPHLARDRRLREHGGRRSGPGRGLPRGAPGGELISLTATEFELLRLPDAQPQAGDVQGADPRPGVELRLRRSGQHRRAVHLLPAQEDRRRPGADDPHHAGLRLCPQARRPEHRIGAPGAARPSRPGAAGRSPCAPS